MAEIKKYKGIVKNKTFAKIISESEDHTYTVNGGVLFRNKTNTFFAKPHRTQYMDIFIIFGSEVFL